MNDQILTTFLEQQLEQGLALARESDIVDVKPLGSPADRFLLRFTCNGLVRKADGSIVEASEFLVGVRFPSDYLRRAEVFEVVTWLGPRNVWHPNIASQAPLICVGNVTPGTTLVDLVYQIWEVITWNKVKMEEPMNEAACQWARSNLARLPVDTRPLKRRPLSIEAVDMSPGGGRAH